MRFTVLDTINAEVVPMLVSVEQRFLKLANASKTFDSRRRNLILNKILYTVTTSALKGDQVKYSKQVFGLQPYCLLDIRTDGVLNMPKDSTYEGLVYLPSLESTQSTVDLTGEEDTSLKYARRKSSYNNYAEQEDCLL